MIPVDIWLNDSNKQTEVDKPLAVQAQKILQWCPASVSRLAHHVPTRNKTESQNGETKPAWIQLHVFATYFMWKSLEETGRRESTEDHVRPTDHFHIQIKSRKLNIKWQYNEIAWEFCMHHYKLAFLLRASCDKNHILCKPLSKKVTFYK